MRQRITFFHQPEDAFQANQLLVDRKKLTVKDLHAAREDRVTFGQNDLPSRVYQPKDFKLSSAMLIPYSCFRL